MDDAVREIHGVRCRKDKDASASSVIIRERDDEIYIDERQSGCILTPWQARYLAAKLYRLSRRIRQRQEAAEVVRAQLSDVARGIAA